MLFDRRRGQGHGAAGSGVRLLGAIRPLGGSRRLTGESRITRGDLRRMAPEAVIGRQPGEERPFVFDAVVRIHGL